MNAGPETDMDPTEDPDGVREAARLFASSSSLEGESCLRLILDPSDSMPDRGVDVPETGSNSLGFIENRRVRRICERGVRITCSFVLALRWLSGTAPNIISPSKSRLYPP
jgi:hypothetical protein